MLKFAVMQSQKLIAFSGDKFLYPFLMPLLKSSSVALNLFQIDFPTITPKIFRRKLPSSFLKCAWVYNLKLYKNNTPPQLTHGTVYITWRF